MFPHRSIGPHNQWDKFRPARDLRTARRKQRRIPVALILATALFFAFLLADQLRPRVEAALAYVAKVALGPKREEVPLPRRSDSQKRPRPYQTHNRRDLRFSRPELGPFDAYVLDGSRYIRVEGKDSYALVDTTTGKITWITKLDKRRVQVQHNALDKQAANHRETSENR
jgi:hypothetical protein